MDGTERVGIERLCALLAVTTANQQRCVQNSRKATEAQISHRADNDLGYRDQLLAKRVIESSPIQKLFGGGFPNNLFGHAFGL